MTVLISKIQYLMLLNLVENCDDSNVTTWNQFSQEVEPLFPLFAEDMLDFNSFGQISLKSSGVSETSVFLWGLLPVVSPSLLSDYTSKIWGQDSTPPCCLKLSNIQRKPYSWLQITAFSTSFLPDGLLGNPWTIIHHAPTHLPRFIKIELNS